jgi:hypothetical protein
MYEITHQRRFNKSGLIFAGLILFLMVGAFYGCQFLQPKENPSELNDQMPLYRRIGILKSLGGVRTSNSGTHILQLDNGDTILLKSIQINMDDPTYLGKTVEVRGILTYTTDNKQIMEVMNIDLVQQDAEAAGTTASWKDLKNTEMGLTIKYKDDLKVDEKTGEIVFSKEVVPVTETQVETATSESQMVETAADTEETAKSTDAIVHKLTISKATLGKDETVYTKAGLASSSAEMLSSGVSRSRIGSGSYEALKKVDGNTTSYFISAGKAVYTVKIETGSDESTLQDQNMFYEMLGTLELDTATAGAGETDLENNSTQLDTEQSVTEETQAVKKDVEKVADSSSDVKSDSKSVTTSQETTEAVKDSEQVTETAETTEETATQATTETQASTIEGYEKLESESFKFSMQYPKSWYYSGSAGADQNVIRHYEFGSKPLEEVPGDVSMDLMSGAIPSGSATTLNGKELTVVSSSTGVDVYVKGSGSRIYKFSGPMSDKSTLENMAASITD